MKIVDLFDDMYLLSKSFMCDQSICLQDSFAPNNIIVLAISIFVLL